MAQQIQNKRKISARSALLIGLLIGLAGTAAIYSITNTLAQTSTQTDQNFPYASYGFMRENHPRMWFSNGTYGCLGFRAISRIQDVSITGFSIIGAQQITLNLQYTGTGTSPAVTIVAMSQGLSGSIVQQAGWGASSTVTVNMVGSGSLSSTCNYLRVLVIPYTG